MINGNNLIIILCIILIVLIYLYYKKRENYTIDSIDFSWRNGKVNGVTKWILVGEFPSLEGDGKRTITKEYTDTSLLKNYTDVSVNFLKDTLFDYKISSGNVKLTLYYNTKGVNNEVGYKEFLVNKDEISLKKSQITKVEGPEIKWPLQGADNLPDEGWYQIKGGFFTADYPQRVTQDYYYYVDEDNKVKTAGKDWNSTNYIPGISISCSTLFYLSYKTTSEDRGKDGNFQLQTVMGQTIDSDALKWCIIGEDKSITCSAVSKPDKASFRLYTEKKGVVPRSWFSPKQPDFNIIGKNPTDENEEYCKVGNESKAMHYCRSDAESYFGRRSKYHNTSSDITCDDEDYPIKEENRVLDSTQGNKGKPVCNVSETKDILEGVHFVKFDMNNLDKTITMDKIYEAQDLLGLPRSYDIRKVTEVAYNKKKDAETRDEKTKIDNAKKILLSISGFMSSGSCDPKTYNTKIKEKEAVDKEEAATKKAKADYLIKYGKIIEGKDLPMGIEQAPTFYIHVPPTIKETTFEYRNQGSKSKIIADENKLKIVNNEAGTKAGISGNINFPLKLVNEGKDRSMVLVFSTTPNVDTDRLVTGDFGNLDYPSRLLNAGDAHISCGATLCRSFKENRLEGAIGILNGKLIISGKNTGLVVSKSEWHILIITQKVIIGEKKTYDNDATDTDRDRTREFTREVYIPSRDDWGNTYIRYPEYVTKVKLISDKTVSNGSPLFEEQETQLIDDTLYKEDNTQPKIFYPAIPEQITTIQPCKGGLISSFAYFDVTLTSDEITLLSDYYKTKNLNTDVLKTENLLGKSPTFKDDSSTWTWDNVNKKLKLNTTIENPDESDYYSIIICDMKDNYTANELNLTFANIRPPSNIRDNTPMNKLKYKVQSVLKIEKQTEKEIELIIDLSSLSIDDHGFLAVIAPRAENNLENSSRFQTNNVGDQILIDDGVLYANFVNDSKIITTTVKNYESESGAKYRYDIYADDNFAGVFSQDPYKNKFYIRYIGYLKYSDHNSENLEYGYVREEYNDRNQPEVESPVKIPVFNETTGNMELSDDKEYSLPDKKDVPRYTKDDSDQSLIIKTGPVGYKYYILNRNKTNIPYSTQFNTNGKYPYIKGNSKVYSYNGYHYFKWDDVLKTEPLFTIYSDAKIGKGIIFTYQSAKFRINLTVKETLQSDNTTTKEIYKTDYITFSNNSRISGSLPEQYNQNVSVSDFGDDNGVSETARRSKVRVDFNNMWNSVNTNLSVARNFWQILPFNVGESDYKRPRYVAPSPPANAPSPPAYFSESVKLTSIENDARSLELGSSPSSSLPERKPIETLYPINDIGDNPVRPVDKKDGKKAHEAFKHGQYGSSVSISDNIMVIGAPNTGKGKKIAVKVKDGTTNVIEFDEDGKRKDVLITKEIYEYPDSGAAFIMKRDSEDSEWYNIGIVRGGNSRDKTGSAVSVDKGYVAITSVGDEENSVIPVPQMSSFQKDSEGIIIWATENVDGITKSSLKSQKKYKTGYIADDKKLDKWEDYVTNIDGNDDAWGKNSIENLKNDYYGYIAENGRKIYVDKDGVRYFDGEYEYVDENRTYFTKEERSGKTWKMRLEKLPWSGSKPSSYKIIEGHTSSNGIRLRKRGKFIVNYDKEGEEKFIEDVNGEYRYSIEYLPEEKQNEIILGYQKNVLDKYYDYTKTSDNDKKMTLSDQYTMRDKYKLTYMWNPSGSVGFLRVINNKIEFLGDVHLPEYRPINEMESFGTSVSICVFKSGSVFAAVGQPVYQGPIPEWGYPGKSDMVHIFRKSRTGKKFVFIKTLYGPKKANFGASVSISEGKLLVGAPLADGGKGAAYIYNMNPSNYYDWGGGKMIVPGENDIMKGSWDEMSISLEEGDNFGESVSLSNNIMAIGAPGKTIYKKGRTTSLFYPKNDKLEEIGSVYIYDKLKDQPGKWAQSIIMPNTNVTPFDLPHSEFVNGKRQTSSGTLYSFDQTYLDTNGVKYNDEDYVNTGKWRHREFSGQNDPRNMRFGSSVSIDNNKLAVGAPYEVTYSEEDFNDGKNSAGKSNTGSVSSYTRDPSTGVWALVQEYQDVLGQAESLETKSRFGTSVDVDSAGNQIAVGVPGYTPFYNRKENTGRAMVYSLDNDLGKDESTRSAKDLVAGRKLCNSVVRFVDKDNKTEFANKIGPWESDGNYTNFVSAGKSNILKNNERVGVIDDEVEYMTINAFSSGSDSCENMMPNIQPPPVPTFNQKLFFLDKTVTIKFTDITNAHESYTLQIEREDGTVLKTKKFKKGDTSITLSYEESSYATYKYVIKLIYADDIISTSTNSLEVKKIEGRCLSEFAVTCGLSACMNGDKIGVDNLFRDRDSNYYTITNEPEDTYDGYIAARNAFNNSETLKKYKQKILDLIEEKEKGYQAEQWNYKKEVDGKMVDRTVDEIYNDTSDWQPEFRHDAWQVTDIFIEPYEIKEVSLWGSTPQAEGGGLETCQSGIGSWLSDCQPSSTDPYSVGFKLYFRAKRQTSYKNGGRYGGGTCDAANFVKKEYPEPVIAINKFVSPPPSRYRGGR